MSIAQQHILYIVCPHTAKKGLKGAVVVRVGAQMVSKALLPVEESLFHMCS